MGIIVCLISILPHLTKQSELTLRFHPTSLCRIISKDEKENRPNAFQLLVGRKKYFAFLVCLLNSFCYNMLFLNWGLFTALARLNR